jgi:hypothetical protein
MPGTGARYECRPPVEVEDAMVTRVTLATILVVLAAGPAPAQERFSFFQASTPESVERMLAG